jgi:hypothetical protein
LSADVQKRSPGAYGPGNAVVSMAGVVELLDPERQSMSVSNSFKVGTRHPEP